MRPGDEKKRQKTKGENHDDRDGAGILIPDPCPCPGRRHGLDLLPFLKEEDS